MYPLEIFELQVTEYPSRCGLNPTFTVSDNQKKWRCSMTGQRQEDSGTTCLSAWLTWWVSVLKGVLYLPNKICIFKFHKCTHQHPKGHFCISFYHKRKHLPTLLLSLKFISSCRGDGLWWLALTDQPSPSKDASLTARARRAPPANWELWVWKKGVEGWFGLGNQPVSATRKY